MMSSGVHHFAWKHTYHEKIKVTGRGSSLVVQWLVLRAFSALGSIIGQGTKISTSGQKKKKMQVEQGSEGRAHPVWGGARGSSGCASQSGDPTKGPGRGDFNGT